MVHVAREYVHQKLELVICPLPPRPIRPRISRLKKYPQRPPKASTDYYHLSTTPPCASPSNYSHSCRARPRLQQPRSQAEILTQESRSARDHDDRLRLRKVRGGEPGRLVCALLPWPRPDWVLQGTHVCLESHSPAGFYANLAMGIGY